MSITSTGRDTIDVSLPAGRMRKRVNFGAVIGGDAAGALLLAGQASVNYGSTTQAIVVSADGALSGSVQVTLTITHELGLPIGSLSAASVIITPAAETASVMYTPASEGRVTITAQAAGMTPATLLIEVLPAGSPAPTTANWILWHDPAVAWEAGSAPNNYRGRAVKRRFQYETDGVGAGAITSIDSWKADGTYANLTPTEIQRGEVTPTYAIIRRVTDPIVGTRTAYQMRLDKLETGWINGTKFRAESNFVGDVEQFDYGTECIMAIGLLLPPEYLLSQPQATYWDTLCQCHAGPLCKNPAIAIQLQGGSGVAANSALTYEIRRYAGAGWPDAPVGGSVTMQKGTLKAAPQANVWQYILVHYRENCGYSDPTPGRGDIYGPTDAPNGFVRIYHAQGETNPPVLVAAYAGFWGGPQAPTSAKAANVVDGKSQIVGVWKSGIYAKTNYLPAAAGDLRAVHNRGVKLWVVADNPNIDVVAALASYRTGS